MTHGPRERRLSEWADLVDERVSESALEGAGGTADRDDTEWAVGETEAGDADATTRAE
jgi:hypothetical protein